jgi:putative transposase
VERIWRREGLKVPGKQPKRGRLWLNDGSCIRLRPCWANQVWAYDFTRECLAILVARRLRADDVLACLADPFIVHGVPDHIRSDNGPEFAAKAVRSWLGGLGVEALFIEPGSPWENGYGESFMYGRPPRCKGSVDVVRWSGACMDPACSRGRHDRWP